MAKYKTLIKRSGHKLINIFDLDGIKVTALEGKEHKRLHMQSRLFFKWNGFRSMRGHFGYMESFALSDYAIYKTAKQKDPRIKRFYFVEVLSEQGTNPKTIKKKRRLDKKGQLFFVISNKNKNKHLLKDFERVVYIKENGYAYSSCPFLKDYDPKEDLKRRKKSKKIRIGKKPREKIFLWESMFAVAHPNNKQIDFTNITPQELVEFYLIRQSKKGRAKYIRAVQEDLENALEIAEIIILRRKVQLGIEK